MGIKLLEAGMKSFLIIEESCEIGGTWWDNRYPGCACDIPSHLYSFSFAPSTEWTRMYPGQQEIHDYLKRCVERYGLAPYLRLNTRFQEAIWDESEGAWNVTVGDGMQIRARVVVSGMGALHVPRYPELPASNAFLAARFIPRRGITRWISTARTLPSLAPVPAPSNSFRRLLPASASSIFPAHAAVDRSALDFAISEKWKQRFRRVPLTRWAFRQYIFWRQEIRVLGFLGNETFRKKVEAVALRHMGRRIKDPKLRAALTPKYQLGCKRFSFQTTTIPPSIVRTSNSSPKGLLKSASTASSRGTA